MFATRCLVLLVVVCIHLSPLVRSDHLRGADEHKERRLEDGGITRDYQYDDPTIVGGIPAVDGEFPFYVKFDGQILCGGSLISNDTILTAAHCIENDAPVTRVRIGATTLSGGVVASVKCAIRNPNAIESRTTLQNDVAIIKLSQPVDAPGIVSTIKFNKNKSYPSQAGTPLTVIGFGLTSPNGKSISTQLLKLQTELVSIDQCMSSYPKNVVTQQSHICADVKKAGDCNGDSGGPVFDDNGLQVGIVSFGYGGCAADSFQDVYVNVASYADWIQSYVDGENCQPANYGGNGGTGGAGGAGGIKPGSINTIAATALSFLSLLVQSLSNLFGQNNGFLGSLLKWGGGGRQ